MLLVPARRPRLSPVVLVALHRLGDRAFAVFFWLASTLLGRAAAVALTSRWRPVRVQLDELELAGDVDARHAARAALEELRARGYSLNVRVDRACGRVHVATTISFAFVSIPSRSVDADELARALQWAVDMHGAREAIGRLIERFGRDGAIALARCLRLAELAAYRVDRQIASGDPDREADALMALRDAWTALRAAEGPDAARRVFVDAELDALKLRAWRVGDRALYLAEQHGTVATAAALVARLELPKGETSRLAGELDVVTSHVGSTDDELAGLVERTDAALGGLWLDLVRARDFDAVLADMDAAARDLAARPADSALVA